VSNDLEALAPLRALVEAEGLELFGVCRLGPEGDYDRFERWLEDGRHADMGYLEQNRTLREDPRGLLAGARTAIVVGLPYYLGDRTPPRTGDPAGPRVAQYARFADYHKLLWRHGEKVLAQVLARYGPEGAGRVVVDSAPVLERALAARSGAGFIGKNTCFISPRQGSFFLLGEILTSLALPLTGGQAVDPARRGAEGGCGSCRRCQVHCPTGALDEDYKLDARLCLSYWTIEHRGPIPERFWPWLRVYVYGCDICQLVCPYNRQARPAAATMTPRVPAHLPLYEVATMTQPDYERMFGGTPMTRAKREGLVRNALVAMTVVGDPRLEAAIAVCQQQGELPAVVHATIEQIRRWQAH